jgi:hypothetical protein
MSDKVTKLPEAIEVEGMSFDPITEKVQLQYRSEDGLNVLSIPLAEALKSEGWFITLRQHIGQYAARRKK